MLTTHRISAGSKSSNRTSAFVMPSQVRRTFMRKKRKYSSKNQAALIGLLSCTIHLGYFSGGEGGIRTHGTLRYA